MLSKEQIYLNRCMLETRSCVLKLSGLMLSSKTRSRTKHPQVGTAHIVPKPKKVKHVKLRALAAIWAVELLAFAIYGYIDGETLFESFVLIGLGIFMAFIEVTGPIKPKPD